MSISTFGFAYRFAVICVWFLCMTSLWSEQNWWDISEKVPYPLGCFTMYWLNAPKSYYAVCRSSVILPPFSVVFEITKKRKFLKQAVQNSILWVIFCSFSSSFKARIEILVSQTQLIASATKVFCFAVRNLSEIWNLSPNSSKDREVTNIFIKQ